MQGRAYPTGWQTTLNVYAKDDSGSIMLPNAMTSGDGTTIVSNRLDNLHVNLTNISSS